MIQLLFTVILMEASAIMLLLFKTPLRKLVLMGLDHLKQGRGPIVVKTVCATIFVVLLTTVNSVLQITRRRDDETPDLTPTDQVLFSKHLLEASLMGFILFLALMTDRLHHYIRELSMRRKTMEVTKRNNGVKIAGPEEIRAREQQVETFKEMIRQLESELEGKIKEAHSSEATVEALRRQTEGLLIEYDRLVGENQSLRNQVQFVDQGYSSSAFKKDS